MRRALLPAAALALAVALAALALASGGAAPASGGDCTPADRPPPPPEPVTPCAACRQRSEAIKVRMAVLRGYLLMQLGWAHAPNTTGRVLPHVPSDMVMMASEPPNVHQQSDMQADQPTSRHTFHDDHDDMHATTDRIIAFPR